MVEMAEGWLQRAARGKSKRCGQWRREDGMAVINEAAESVQQSRTVMDVLRRD